MGTTSRDENCLTELLLKGPWFNSYKIVPSQKKRNKKENFNGKELAEFSLKHQLVVISCELKTSDFYAKQKEIQGL